MSFHEADVSLLRNLNVFMSNPLERFSGGKIDPFRSTLMHLFDFPGDFTRQLKNEEIDTTGAKLNMMVGLKDRFLLFLTIKVIVAGRIHR